MTKNSRAKLVSLLLAAMGVMGAFASAAQGQGTEPGQSDPVGPPSSYIILRNDNLALSYVSGADNVFDTFEADLNNPDAFFDNRLTSNKVPQAGAGSSVSVAGRILSQDKDQLVIVGRSGSMPNAIKVRFALGGDYALSNLHDRLADAPDQISVAAGDLDKIPDANGANHDELVVAYAGKNGDVNMAVLNYTAPQAVASSPIYVTQAVAPFKVNLNPTAPDLINGGEQKGFKVSEVLAVAIGDFDGDGQNEIALATLDDQDQDQVNLAIFRYVHTTLSATPQLKLVTTKSFSNIGGGYGLLPTISLAAGDFEGTGRRAELVLAVRQYTWDADYWYLGNYRLETISLDDNLNPTLKTDFENCCVSVDKEALGLPSDIFTAGRILLLSGLIYYNPSHDFDLYRRGVVVLWNQIWGVDYAQTHGDLSIDTYIMVDKIGDMLKYGNIAHLANEGVNASFAATLGGFGVNGNINNPVWSLAVAQVRSDGSTPTEPKPNEETVSVFQNINGQGFNPDPIAVGSFKSDCSISVCDSTTQNALRPAIQAYDYEGRTVLFGASIKITVPKLITTDFVLQDPPKHAYWDEKNQKLVVVSRIPGIAASMTNKDGVTYSGKSTDTSASSVGGSDSATASASIKTDVLGIFKVKASAEVTAKATYNYDVNQASYNSNYVSRTLTETESTVGDDFVSGRYQQLTIWRYRVLGENAPDAAGKTLNLYYDVAFPGPSLEFKASGLDLDWYQPIQEPGNILSYPAPSDDMFSPADIGTYDIPCPAGATDCKPNGTEVVAGPMIPATEEFLSDTSGSIALNYVNTSGSGNQVGYQKKLGTSLDVKVSYSAEVGFFGGEAGGNYATNLNSNNSWGNTTTSDSTSTSETGITITRAAIGSPQAYAIYPTLYTTLDGTIKVAFAADPLESAAGKSFWAGLYGALPDPALNLPLRFELNGSQWVVDDSSSRKQMRGFFVLGQDPDPVTGQYDILGQAAVDGQKVRLSAQVYNYSTAKSFKDCLVQFYAIKYDSSSDREEGARRLIGQTTISLDPRATAPAQIIWDTKGFGPTSGSQDYRIYVDLNYDKKINETYPPEDSNKIYTPGLPKGVDPGQNDEGFGLASVMAAAPAAPSNYYGAPAVTFSSTPLAALVTGNLSSELVTSNLTDSAGVPVRLRAQVCSTANSRDSVDVIVFDGDPSGGKVIAWKRIYAPGKGQCDGTWFSWTPTRGDHNLVATIDPIAAPSIIASNALLMTNLPPNRASLQVHVP